MDKENEVQDYLEGKLSKDEEMKSFMNYEVHHLGEVIDLFEKEFV